MSRSFTRGLLVAPLLATALMVSACGGDDAPEQATANPPVATTAGELGTSPSTPAETTPADTTPATSPDAASKDASKDDKSSAKKDDEAPDAAEAPATNAPAATAVAAQPEAPGNLRPSAERAQTEVLKVLTAMDTCFTTTSDYAKCQSAKQVNKFGGDAVDSKLPKPTQVAVTRATKASFKIVATDKAGTRWVLTKFKSGQVTRKCKRANGDVCNPATW